MIFEYLENSTRKLDSVKFEPLIKQEMRSVVCRTLSLSNATLFHCWSGDVYPVQNLLLCTKLHENLMIFRWDMAIDFQNGGRPPSWNCFATIQDHPRSLCCWLQLPVKFHVNLIHRSEDIAIWIVRIVGLKCLFRPPKWGFGERWTPEREYSSSRPPTVTSLRKSASFKLSTIKIRWGVWPVGEFSENVTDTQTDRQTHTHTQ